MASRMATVSDDDGNDSNGDSKRRPNERRDEHLDSSIFDLQDHDDDDDDPGRATIKLRAAIAVAPVTEWEYYDAIYTEVRNALRQLVSLLLILHAAVYAFTAGQ